MNQNPFLSKTFSSIWLKYFNHGRKPFEFDFINNVKFLKHKYLPIYFNVGRNITNGMYYTLLDTKEKNNNKTFLIHDVPEYFNVTTNTLSTILKVNKVKQYKGYLADLSQFNTFEEFFNSQFRSKRRNYLRKKQQQLELCFDIAYKFYYGEVSKDKYNEYMLVFKNLISKRFGELGIDNDVISNWDYYKELIYKMILEKRALLFVIQRENNPIGVAFSFISDNILFYATPIFDTDYIRFNLGHTTIIELMKWCFNNDISYYDFSKGEFEYKKRWTNKEYVFEAHILFHEKSFKASLLGNYLTIYFTFKQFLRDKKINLLYSKIIYKIKNFKLRDKNKVAYKINEIVERINLEEFDVINNYKTENAYLELVIINSLSRKPESIRNIKVYKEKFNSKNYLVIGEKNKFFIELIS